MNADEFARILGQNLRRMRLRRGWTAKVAAAKMEMSIEDVYKIEYGQRMPSPYKIMKATNVLNCNLLDIFAGLDPRNPDVSKDELRVLSPNSSATMRWLATKWDGDIDALIAYIGMIALFPEDVRREIYLDGISIRDKLIQSGVISRDQLPPGTDHMEQQLGGLYDMIEGRGSHEH